MTPKMKKLLKSMKSLTAYELAAMEASHEGSGAALMQVLIGLDKTLEHVRTGMIYGLTPQEFETARTRKIQAIKMVRERTTMGLADAKNHVEEAIRRAAVVDLGSTKI